MIDNAARRPLRPQNGSICGLFQAGKFAAVVAFVALMPSVAQSEIVFRHKPGVVGTIGGSSADIAPPVWVTSQTLPSAIVGVPYSILLHANDESPVVYEIVGAPISGLTIDSVTGEYSGTPTEADEAASFLVSARDSSGNLSQRRFYLEISEGEDITPPVWMTTGPALPAGIIGVPYSSTVLAVDDRSAVIYSAYGESDWMVIDPDTGEISGIPTSLGRAITTVRASDEAGNYSQRQFMVLVNEPALNWTGEGVGDGTVGAAYHAWVLAESETPGVEVEYSIVHGTHPPSWLSLDPATGNMTGLPTVPGSHSFLVRATSQFGNYIDQVVSFDILPPS